MNKYIIPNLKKACNVLKLLTQEPQGLSLNEISERLDIPKTTALRILTTFCGENMASKRDAKYFVGMALVQTGLSGLASMDVRTVAVPVLQDLAQATGETAHLAVLSGDRAMLVEVCDSPHPFRVASRPGTLVPLHCSSAGKVLIAYAIEEDLADFFRGANLETRTPNTITRIDELEEEAERIRSRGYAVDEEEYYPDVRCIAAPVWDDHGDVVAAVGITGTATRFTPEKVEPFSVLVVEAAGRVSEGLGARSLVER